MSSTTRLPRVLLLLLGLSLALASLPLASASAAPGHWRGKAWFAYAAEDATEETAEPTDPPAETDQPTETDQSIETAATEPEPTAPEPIPTDTAPAEAAPVEDDPAEPSADPAPVVEAEIETEPVPDIPDPGEEIDTIIDAAVEPEASAPEPASETSEPAAPEADEAADSDAPASPEVESADTDDFTAAAAPIAVDDFFGAHQGTPTDLLPLLANDTDADADSLEIVSVTLPANGTVVVQNVFDGTAIYTSNPGFTGIDTFTYIVTDGVSSDTGTVTMTVVAPAGNTPPVAVDDFFGRPDLGTLGFQINILANDTDAEGHDLALVSLGTPTPTGSIRVFLADAEFGLVNIAPDGFVGTATFTYVIIDGQATDTGTVTITIRPVGDNQPPVATDDTATVTTGNSINIDVLANDSDPDGDPIDLPPVSPVSDPANGSTGTSRDLGGTRVHYQPNPGFVGTDTFTYNVTDGAATSTGTVTVTVLPAQTNLPPIAVDDNYTTVQDTPLQIPLSCIFANDSDPDGDDFGFSSANGVPTAAHGSLTVSAGDGAFLYTPDPGFAGTDSFQYQLTDGQALSNVATVTIQVTAAPDPPDPDPAPDPPDDEPEKPKAENPAPKQPAAKPAPKPAADVATTLPDTGAGPFAGRDEDHALLLGLLAILFAALLVLRRRLA